MSLEAAKLIDDRLALGDRDPCAGLQRDHFHTWRTTAEFFFSQSTLGREDFWAEMKRRNEVALLTRADHSKLVLHQRTAQGVGCATAWPIFSSCTSISGQLSSRDTKRASSGSIGLRRRREAVVLRDKAN